MSEKTKDCSTCNYKPSFSDTCRSCHAYSNWDWRGPEPKKEPSFNEELKAIQRMIEYRYGTHSPISRVRSVTDTSMMFMIPMPPTRSEMAATIPRSSGKVCVVP